MWARPLWNREYAQARLFIFAVPIVHFLLLGLQRLNMWVFSDTSIIKVHQQTAQHALHPALEAYNYGGYEVSGRCWLLLAVFVLSLVQLGTERRNGSQELLFSLPYSRKQIFLTKWLLGAALITGSLLLNTVIDMIVAASSAMSEYFSFSYHFAQFGYSWLVLLAIYSLGLFMGSITGSVMSQTVLSLLLFVLPAGIILLVSSSLNIQGVNLYEYGDVMSRSYPQLLSTKIQSALNLIGYATVTHEEISWKRVLSMVLLLAVALLGGILSYTRNRTENNGKLIIFAGWEAVLQIGFIVCISMVAGLLASSIFSRHERLGYDIGLLAGVVVSTVIILKLTRIRLKV